MFLHSKHSNFVVLVIAGAVRYIYKYKCSYSNEGSGRKIDLSVAIINWGFPGGGSGKEPAYQCERHKRCGLGRSLREGNGNPLQYACLENPMDRGACQAIVHRVTESDTTEVT